MNGSPSSFTIGIRPFFVIGCLLLVLSAALTIWHARQATLAHTTLSEKLSLAGRRSQALDSALKYLSFGLHKGAQRNEEEITHLRSSESYHATRATISGWSCFVLGVIWLGSVWTSKASLQGELARSVTIGLVVTAVFLLIGLLAPFFRVENIGHYRLIGAIVHEHETLSIMGTVGKLLKVNPAVALLVLLFSVVTPISKIALAFAVLHRKPNADKAQSILRIIGKWSMTDVFVAAILLTFFSLQKGMDGTVASLGIGFWFFSAHAFLSIVLMNLLPTAAGAQKMLVSISH